MSRQHRGGIRRISAVDAEALRENARHLLSNARGPLRADLRANAFGLGVRWVLDALRGTGFADADDPTASPVSEWLYGASPGARPVVRLSGQLVSVKRVRAGQGVSYGYTYRTDRPTALGLVGLGYADGVVRRSSNTAPVVVGGRPLKVTGRVAMDQFIIDLGDGQAEVGDEVVLFGDPTRDEPSIFDWSEATGWPASALLAGLGPRIERVEACPTR